MVDIIFKTETNEEAMDIATKIHEGLAGCPAYVDSNIFLNVENNVITLGLGTEENTAEDYELNVDLKFKD